MLNVPARARPSRGPTAKLTTPFEAAAAAIPPPSFRLSHARACELPARRKETHARDEVRTQIEEWGMTFRGGGLPRGAVAGAAAATAGAAAGAIGAYAVGRRRVPCPPGRAAAALSAEAAPEEPASAGEDGREEDSTFFGGAEEEGLSREELGRGAWGLLHTVAASFPEEPSRRDRREASRLLNALAWLYPCGECAEHFQEFLRAEPPALGSRTAFAQWLCRTHNRVNTSLDKPQFDCSAVDLRWSPLACESGVGGRDACARR